MVKENQQLDLFSEQPAEEQVAPTEPDFALIVAAGDRRNATYDPNTRAAENRRGSGGGFAAAVAGEIDFEPSTTSTPNPRGKIDRRKLSPRAQLMADREPDTEHNPAYKPNKELDERTKAIGRMGVALTREILRARKKER